jgi:hypothetical protein
MRAAAIACLLAGFSSGACADLIGVATSQDYVWSFYRISTDDASSELITQVQHVLDIESLTFGPDGTYYMITVCAIYRIDPFTGETEYLHRTTDFPSVGGQCMRDDGVLFSMINRYGSAYFQGWDIYEDEYADSVGTKPALLATAAQVRSDGALVAMTYNDPTLYEVDWQTSQVTPIASFGDDVTGVSDFATDPASGAEYAIMRDASNVWALWRVDLFTAERSLVGVLPDQRTRAIAGMQRCVADFNADGVLTILDFVAMQIAWQAGDDAADVNGDGGFDVLDFVAYQQLFVKGCRS